MGDRSEENTMTDEQSTTPPGDKDATDTAAPGADETFGWTADEASGQTTTGNTAERMVAQLQSMIDSIATQAAPVVRQVGIKAAELAAAAADRAGPIAHKAADATASASVKVAERSRVIAADLRREVTGTNGSSSENAGSTTAVIDGVDDASEQSAKDDPAEGSR
jgi:hypothetical protein